MGVRRMHYRRANIFVQTAGQILRVECEKNSLCRVRLCQFRCWQCQQSPVPPSLTHGLRAGRVRTWLVAP